MIWMLVREVGLTGTLHASGIQLQIPWSVGSVRTGPARGAMVTGDSECFGFGDRSRSDTDRLHPSFACGQVAVLLKS